MINRYIYAVTQRLPQSQRDDISEELKGLIEDMLDERVQDGKVTDKDVEGVLLELGNPKRLAQSYRGTRKYIIGPELYDSYVSVLKIVLLSLVAAMTIGFAIEIVINPPAILDHFVDYIVSFFTIIPQGIGWVTFGFVVIDYSGGGKIQAKHLNMDKDWKPADLAPIPDPKRQIKRGETIFSIAFYVLFIALFAFSSDYFGVFIFNDDKPFTIIPFLNEETLSIYLPLLILILGLSILKETLKLISGKWTLKLVLYAGLINAVSLVVVFFMVSESDFWNPDFMQELTSAGIITKGNEGYRTIANIWNASTFWVLIVLIVGLIWEAISGFIKIGRS